MCADGHVSPFDHPCFSSASRPQRNVFLTSPVKRDYGHVFRVSLVKIGILRVIYLPGAVRRVRQRRLFFGVVFCARSRWRACPYFFVAVDR